MTRAEYRAAGDAKRRASAREREALMTEPVAFPRTEDAHRIDQNANRGKRHAASMRQDPRTSENEGRRARGESMTRRHLETSWQGIPSLGSALTKRALTPESRG